MAPHAENGDVSVIAADTSKTTVNGHVAKNSSNEGKLASEAGQFRKPLELNGSLETFDYFDVTPIIGREFQNVDVVEWLQAPNSDELIRDLAITSRSNWRSKMYLISR